MSEAFSSPSKISAMYSVHLTGARWIRHGPNVLTPWTFWSECQLKCWLYLQTFFSKLHGLHWQNLSYYITQEINLMIFLKSTCILRNNSCYKPKQTCIKLPNRRFLTNSYIPVSRPPKSIYGRFALIAKLSSSFRIFIR